MKKLLLTLTLIIMASSIQVMAAPSQWAQDTVNKANSAGVIPAALNNDFQKPIQRDEFVGLLVNGIEQVLGITLQAGSDNFNDISGNPYISQIQKSVSCGIVNGTSDTSFSPKSTLTREQAAVIFANAFYNVGAPERPFAGNATFNDSNEISSWAVDSVNSMCQMGIMSGVGNNKFNPKGQLTREQAVTLVARFTGLDNTAQTTVQPEKRDDLWLEVGGVKLNIGMTLTDAKKLLGEPQAVLASSENIVWNVFCDDYSKFVMVGTDKSGIVRKLETTAKTFVTPHAKWGDTANPSKQDYTFYKDPEGKSYTPDAPIIGVSISSSGWGEVDYDPIKTSQALYNDPEYWKVQEQIVFHLTNGFRNAHGLKTLYWDEEAYPVIKAHCQDMVDRNYFSHITPEGLGPQDRLLKMYPNTDKGVHENLVGSGMYAGSGSFYAWVNSPSHRQNLVTIFANGLVVGFAHSLDSGSRSGLLTVMKNGTGMNDYFKN